MPRHFLRSEQGAILAEYALLTVLIAVASVAAVTFFGNRVTNLFSGLLGL